jgi:hypothetical protein
MKLLEAASVMLLFTDVLKSSEEKLKQHLNGSPNSGDVKQDCFQAQSSKAFKTY